MAESRIDIRDAFTHEEGLPRPQWDILSSWVEARVPAPEQGEAWSDICRQWLETLAETLGPEYDVEESNACLMLRPEAKAPLTPLLGFLGRCHEELLADLPGVARFENPGKHVVLLLQDREQYYQYVSAFYSEGRYGGSGGITVREGFPHVVAWGTNIDYLANTLAHEMTHLALTGRTMPQWLEEGLAQRSEQRIAGRQPIHVNERTGRQHRQYWKKHGLVEFWSGAGFHKPGKVQALSYQLAEIVMRILQEECRPRWFGLSRGRHQAMLAFLAAAKADDAGEAAAREHLGHSLADLLSQFLGEGEWTPRLSDDDRFEAPDPATR